MLLYSSVGFKLFRLVSVWNNPCTKHSSNNEGLKSTWLSNVSRLGLSSTISNWTIDTGIYNEEVNDSTINCFCQSYYTTKIKMAAITNCYTLFIACIAIVSTLSGSVSSIDSDNFITSFPDIPSNLFHKVTELKLK